MSSPRETLVLVLSRKVRSRKDQARVEARVAADLCTNKFLVAVGSSETRDCPGTGRKRRGLCPACASAFDRSTRSMTEQQAADHEAEMVLAGLMLREQEIRELKQTNCMRIKQG